MKAGSVYLITNTVNGKEYVGCTTGTVVARFKRHVRDANRDSQILIHRAIRKYGKEAFSVTVLEEVDGSQEDLKQAEIRQIVLHRCIVPQGYNLTGGGDGWAFASPELKQRMKEIARLAQQSPEYRVAFLQGIAKRSADPVWKANHLATMATDAWKEAQQAGVSRRSTDPQWQKNHDDAMRRLWADSEWREVHAEAMRKLTSDPAWLELNRKTLEATMQTESWKKAQREGSRRLTQTPEWRANNLKGARKRAQDPTWLKNNEPIMQRARDAAAAKVAEADALLSPAELAMKLQRREHVQRWLSRSEQIKLERSRGYVFTCRGCDAQFCFLVQWRGRRPLFCTDRCGQHYYYLKNYVPRKGGGRMNDWSAILPSKYRVEKCENWLYRKTPTAEVEKIRLKIAQGKVWCYWFGDFVPIKDWGGEWKKDA